MTRNIFLVFSLFLATAISTFAQDSSGVFREARLYNYWDRAYDVEIELDVAFVAAGRAGLQVVDVSDPGSPRIIGWYDRIHEMAKQVEVQDEIAYVVTFDGGLRTFDVSDPSDPRPMGVFVAENSILEFIVEDETVYLGMPNGLLLVDTSDPADMRVVSQFGGPFYCDGMVKRDRHIFFADRHELHLISVADPNEPRLVRTDSLFALVESIDMAGNYLYVADRMTGMIVVDVSNPFSPRTTAHYDVLGRMRLVEAGEGVVYTAYYDELWILDVSDPSTPRLEGLLEGSVVYFMGMTYHDGFLYEVGYSDGLQVVDVSEPERPQWIGGVNPDGRVLEVTSGGEYAVASCYYQGVKVIDISNPRRPREVGSLDTPGSALDAAIRGDYAYVADGINNLTVVDISDPASPFVAGLAQTTGSASSVTLQGDVAFVTYYVVHFRRGGDVGTEGGGLRMIDISDPIHPREIFYLDTINCYDAAVAGDIVYLGRQDGISVLDVSDLDDVQRLRFIATEDNVTEMQIVDDLLYVTEDRFGLKIFDISERDNPGVLAEYEEADDGEGLHVIGDYAFLATSDHGLRVIDVSDPVHPEETGFYVTTGRASGVTVVGNLAYTADWTNLGVYDISAAIGENASPVWVDYPQEPVQVENGNELVFEFRAVDLNEDEIELSLLGDELPDGAEIEDDGDGSGTLRWETDADDIGVYRAQLVASDGELADTATVRIAVRADNRAPEVERDVFEAEVMEDGGLQVIGNLDSLFHDPEGDDLQFRIDGEVRELRAFIARRNVLTVEPVPDYHTVDGAVFSIVADDGWGGETELEFIVIVLPVNDPPLEFELAAPGWGTVVRDNVTVFAWDEAIDVDGDPLDYSLHLRVQYGDLDTTLAWDAGRSTNFVISGLEERLTSIGLYAEIEADWWAVADDREYRQKSFEEWMVVLPRVQDVRIGADGLPGEFYLADGFPNPFNRTVTIRYGMPLDADVSLQVVDLSGRAIANLAHGRRRAGNHVAVWEAGNFTSGIYWIRMDAAEGEFSDVRKIVLVK